MLLGPLASETSLPPTSLAFGKQVSREMAGRLVTAGRVPFLQFGEVEWRCFPDATGIRQVDDHTKQEFQAVHGRPISGTANNSVSPSQYPGEAAFLPTLIGGFTEHMMSCVRQTVLACKFEVLYPADVNKPQFSRAVNLLATWTPAALHCFKSESLTYTYSPNLDKSAASMKFAGTPGLWARGTSAPGGTQ